MLDRIKSWFGISVDASTQLPPVAPPKVKKGAQALPPYLKSAKTDPNSSLPRTDRQLATTDISRISRSQGTRNVIRSLAHSSPDLSASMFAYLRTAITRHYTVVARNTDGTINPDATGLAKQILTRLDVLPDYSEGFAGLSSIRSMSESLAKELFLYGGMAAELVLDKARLPLKIQPLTVTTIEFRPDGDGTLHPVQNVSGEYRDLDIPTFFYVALDLELMEAYPASPIESAIKPTLFSEQFLADLQRVVRKAVHPRMMVEIDYKSFMQYMPPEAQHDADKAAEYYNNQVTAIQELINSLEPSDALVFNNLMKVELENNGNISLSDEYGAITELSNAKMSTGAKTLPSILGHNVGSSNIASTETVIFMQNAEGMIQFKLNEMFSRILTLAVRLFGQDVYVEFAFDPISLRPQSELESFKQAKQSRVLELLSLGLVTDEEASIQLTGNLPPQGYTPLMGTMFRSAQAASDNPYGGASNDGSTMNQNLKSDAPKGAQGQNKKKNPVKEKQ